jgi:hypothetical protein
VAVAPGARSNHRRRAGGYARRNVISRVRSRLVEAKRVGTIAADQQRGLRVGERREPATWMFQKAVTRDTVSADAAKAGRHPAAVVFSAVMARRVAFEPRMPKAAA